MQEDTGLGGVRGQVLMKEVAWKLGLIWAGRGQASSDAPSHWGKTRNNSGTAGWSAEAKNRHPAHCCREG